MIKIERLSRTKLQVLNETIVSATTGHKKIYIFGIPIITKIYDEDFNEIEDNKVDDSIGFNKTKKKIT